jgi:hypothetical protein
MKLVFSALCSLLALGFLAVGGTAEEKDKEKPKEVTLRGTVLCAKCVLKETKACTTAIQVKDGDKVVTYYLDDKGHSEPYHDAVCGGEKKEGTVTGVVTEKDGKKWIKPRKVDYVKK